MEFSCSGDSEAHSVHVFVVELKGGVVRLVRSGLGPFLELDALFLVEIDGLFHSSSLALLVLVPRSGPVVSRLQNLV